MVYSPRSQYQVVDGCHRAVVEANKTEEKKMTKNVENMKVEASGLGTVRDDVSCLAASRSESSLLLNGTLGCAGKKTTMKKLMIAASAALCAAVGFGDGITSANVVGYSTTELCAGAKATGASFLSIGEDGCKLTDIVPTGFDKTTGGVAIQILDNYGLMAKIYKYYKGGRGSFATDGWYDGTTRITTENDVVFAPGTGLWMTGSDGYSFQTSGQVLFDNVVCKLRTGATMIANPYPMSLKLTNITPAGFEKTSGGVAIQILDNYGMTTKTYKYYKGGRAAYAVDGWYDGTTRITLENDVAFEPGAGLWVDGADGYTLTLSLGTVE